MGFLKTVGAPSKELLFFLYLCTIFTAPFIFFTNIDLFGFAIYPSRVFSLFLFGFLIFKKDFYNSINIDFQLILVCLLFIFMLITTTPGLISDVFELKIYEEYWPLTSNLQMPGERSIVQIISFVTFTFFSFFFALYFIDHTNKITFVLNSFHLAAVLISVHGLVVWIFAQFFKIYLNYMFWYRPGPAGFGIKFIYKDIYIERLYGLGGEPKMVAAFLAIALWQSLIMRKSILSILIIGFSFFLTFSTSGYLIFLLCSLFFLVEFLFIQNNKKRKRSPLVFILLISFIFIFTYKNSIEFKNLIDQRVTSRINQVYSISIGEMLKEQNEGYIHGNLYDILPFQMQQRYLITDPAKIIFGIGYGRTPQEAAEFLKNYGVSFYNQGDTRLFLSRIFLELGLIGLLLYILIFILPIFRNYNIESQGVELVYGSTLRFLTIFSFISASIEVNFYCWIFLGVLHKYNILVSKSNLQQGI